MFTSIDKSGWVWFEGVVEDRNDPAKLGRVKVRVIGIHTPNKEDLPTEDLPWAQVIHPVTSAAMNGIGETPNLLPGTHVSGYFRDGMNCQDPVIWGTIGGIPQELPNPNQGFSDPEGVYPKKEHIDEPDTSRLVRGESLDKTYIKKRNDDANNAEDVKQADGQVWSIPGPSYNAKYPYNKVKETESGHVVEFDDTPGNERIHEMHRKGTYREIDANGTTITRIVGDNYQILDRNGYVIVYGDANTTIEGSSTVYVKNAMHLQVDGNTTATFKNDLTANVYGDMKHNVQGNYKLSVRGDFVQNVEGKYTLSSGDAMSISTAGEYNAASASDFAIDGSVLWLNSGKAGKATGVEIEQLGDRAEPKPAYFPRLPISSISENLYNRHDTPDNPPTQEFYDELKALGLPTESKEPQPATKKETKKEPRPKDGKPVSCEMFAGQTSIPGTTQLSEHYMLRDVSSNAVVSHYPVRAQAGLTESQIVCNLKHTCVNIAEPILAKFPDMFITSGFRYVGNSASAHSQHFVGEAIDMQFRNASKSDYYHIALWVVENLAFSQAIAEYKSGGTGLPWLHVSYNQSNNKGQFFTMYNGKRISDFGVLKQLY